MIDEKAKKELKGILENQKIRMEKELNRFAHPTENPENFETRFTDIGSSRDENATEVEGYVDDLALESNLEGQLKEVNDALEKVEKGNYGICENCGQEISMDRLKAYPAAKVCIKCGKK